MVEARSAEYSRATMSAPRTKPSERAPRLFWMIPIVALFAFANSVPNEFTLDDVEIVRDNPLLESPAHFGRLLTSDAWAHIPAGDHGLYRPATMATYAVQRWTHGANPAGFRLVNILLHAAVSLLLALLVRRLSRDDFAALTAGVLFAVHPVHVEAVVGIVGRAEILACLFTLLAVELSRRVLTREKGGAPLAAACVVCAFAAAASKESGLVAPAIVGWTILVFPSIRPNASLDAKRRHQRRAGALVFALAAAAALFWALRANVIGAHGVNEALSGVNASDRIATALRVGGEYVALLFAPLRLCADDEGGAAGLARSFTQPGVLAGIATLAGLLALLFWTWRRRPLVAWGVGVFLGALFPVSNLAFAIGVVKAERLLYIPSAGFVAALAAGLSALAAKPGARRPVLALVAALALAFTARTALRNRDWRDNCTLARSTVETNPDTAILGAIHARCLLDAKRFDEAHAALERILARRPEFVPALVVAGAVELAEGRDRESLVYFERALAVEPEHRVALSNAAWLEGRAGRFEEARDRYTTWRRAFPADPAPLAGLIATCAQLGDFEGAREAAREGERLFPRDPMVRRNVELLRELEHREEEK